MGHRELTPVLYDLLQRLEVQGDVRLGRVDAARWPEGALPALNSLGLLTLANNTKRTICPGCAEGCEITPTWLPRRGGGTLPVYRCPLRSDIELVRLDAADFRSWQLRPSTLAEALIEAAGLGPLTELTSNLWQLGRIGSGRSRRTVLFANGLTRLQPEERHALLEAHSNRRSVILVPRQKPNDVPAALGEVVSLFDVLEITDDGLFLELEAVAVPPATPKSTVKPVRPPQGMRWESLTIRVVDDEHVQIVFGKKTEVRSYIEMGMVDRRGSPSPNSDWGFLLLLATQGGSQSWSDATASDALRQRANSLQKRLKAAISLPGNPFHPYKRGHGWEVRFSLVDLRGVP